MDQQSQSKMLIGIGAITAVVVAGYFGLDYLGGKKSATSTTAKAAGADYSAAINAATESVAGGDAGAGLNADEAKRIGEQVAREVAAQVAQAIVDQRMGAGGGSGGGGLTEADARRIGEEEGRRVAQEVAAATVQQAMAAGGGGGGAALTAEQAEQIGIAAGRRAAQQVAAATAREVVRNEFGGTVVAKSDAAATGGTTSPSAEAAPAPAGEAPAAAAVASTAAPQGGVDALRAWWTTPASGDFGLLYAGQPKGEPAIALLFSEQPSDSALSQNVKVYDAKGTRVSGTWEAATNPRLAVLRGLQPGRYTVVVEPALANASGKALNRGQHGPVYVI